MNNQLSFYYPVQVFNPKSLQDLLAPYNIDHIRTGGMLIHNGKFIGDRFVSTNDSNQWKFIMLKINDKSYRFIDISTNYIFFRPKQSSSKKI
jgi:hypothetical protein